MSLPDDRVREIAESPLSFAQGTYVDAWYLAKEVAELRAYKERTEAALLTMRSRVQDGAPFERYGIVVTQGPGAVIRVRDMVRADMEQLGLWREDGA